MFIKRGVRRWLLGIPVYVFPAAIAGLVISLFISVLLAFPLSLLPGLWGDITPIGVGLFLAFVAMSIMVLRGRGCLASRSRDRV